MMDLGYRNQPAVESFFNICKIEPPIHEKLIETKKKEQIKKKKMKKRLMKWKPCLPMKASKRRWKKGIEGGSEAGGRKSFQ